MRSLSTFAFTGIVLGSSAAMTDGPPARGVPAVVANPNVERAGTLRGGILTVALEAKESAWRLNGPDRPPMTIAAFSEPGKSPLMPGPLVRAPQGSEIQISVRNELGIPLTFFVPAVIHGGPTGRRAMDSIVVAPGTSGRLTVKALIAGSYVYSAFASGSARSRQPIGPYGLLAGAVVVDSAGPSPPDRVFVIMATMDSLLEAEAADHVVNLNAPDVGRLIFTINGRSWPNTERIAATVGDSVHWKILNASADNHPMHLHGFYYRVDSFSDPRLDPVRDGAERRFLAEDSPGRMVVTQFLPPMSTMSLTWSPSHAGNWIFHCHFALHLMPDAVSAGPNDPHLHGMVGLVLGINVAERAGVHAAGSGAPTRHLRLLAVRDSVATQDPNVIPSMRFVLEERGRRVEAGQGISPEIDLARGEPVSIMIVNRLDEPTSVHWHGIELENAYFDGVPGVSGAGKRVAPAIAPGDSFEARFTPPRAGTFMYHAHVDEAWEQAAGLEGALIVRDRGTAAAADERVFFIKGPRRASGPHRTSTAATELLEINGSSNPDTVVVHVGRPVRLRLLSLATGSPEPRVLLTARPDSAFELRDDSMIVQWRPVAKDGFDLPASAQVTRRAGQAISMGETYDVEFTPERPGSLRLELRVNPQFGGMLLARVPIRVE